jgi:hypothetical protein
MKNTTSRDLNQDISRTDYARSAGFVIKKFLGEPSRAVTVAHALCDEVD